MNFFWSHVQGFNYGYLYNWYAVSDGRNIFNSGWHVPTSAEFSTLIAYLGGGLVAGGHLKEIGFVHWQTPNAGADNSSHFNAKGAGYRLNTDGSYMGLTSQTDIFSSSTFLPFVTCLILGNGATTATFSGYNIKQGNSIRLVKNSTTLTNGQTGSYTGNDGGAYQTICIGTQEWLARNLSETKYANGDLITVVTDNATWAGLSTEARCVYNNTEVYK